MTAALDRPVDVASAGHGGALSGTWQLIRLALRRDRITLPVWILVIAVIPGSAVSAYQQFYPTAAERAALTAGMGANPSLSLLYGPAFDLSTAGGFTAWRYGSLIPLFLALACIFTVTRHTRQEEDTGRLELLASAVLGRYAALTAAVIVAALGSLATGMIAAAGMIGAKLPAGGSLLFGVSIALVGWVFIGVAAITAQLVEFSRTANGMATAALGVAFLLRAVGDSAKDVGWLSWLSPIGWSTQTRPFTGDRWWVLLVLIAAAVVLCAIGFALLPRRDFGMGILPAKPGPSQAAPSLRSPLALAWLLHRGTLIGWLIGFAVMGALFGSLAAGIGDIVGTSDQSKQILERMGGASGIVDAYLGTIVSMLGMIASMYAVQASLRMRSEESAMRVEPLLATAVSRLRWASSHLMFALLGSGLILATGGLLAGLLHGLRIGDVSGQVPTLLGAALAQLPAVWVVAGISVLLFGFLPKYATAAWGVAAFFLLIGLFGPAAKLSQTVLDVSPFTHLPKLPSAEFTATPVFWLLAVAIAAIGFGLARFNRRDIG
jgi:ABC-2 type transport system permease protein